MMSDLGSLEVTTFKIKNIAKNSLSLSLFAEITTAHPRSSDTYCIRTRVLRRNEEIIATKLIRILLHFA